MTGFVSQRPIIGLGLLVVFNLFLVSLQVRNPDGTLMIRSIGLAVYTPPAAFAHYVASSVSGAWRRLVELGVIAERNRLLEAENGRLKLEVRRLGAVDRMLRRTSGLIRVSETFGFDSAYGAVVWRNVPLFSDRMIINIGEREGVRQDAAVLTSDGVVGRVLTTTFTSSEVELLLDSRAAIGAVLETSRLPGVVQGDGSEMLALNFISSAEEVAVGEMVLTSGVDRIYPKGLPIGVVTNCEKAGTYQKISVRPSVDFRKLEEVAVVVN